jgi:Tfp pilus assembly protein PilX
VKEAQGQLQGLKRRKKALEMLGDAVQAGINQQDDDALSAAEAAAAAAKAVTTTTTVLSTSLSTKGPSKRKLGSDNTDVTSIEGKSQSQPQQQPYQPTSVEVSSHHEDGPTTKRAKKE